MNKIIQLDKQFYPGTVGSIEISCREIVAEECSRCGKCVKECAFLQRYGFPGQIAVMDHTLEASRDIAFSCSLCQLCTHICPQQLPVSEMFLELRKEATAAGPKLLKRYRPLRFYEGIGGSKLMSGYYLPKGCDTAFFPGCSLPGIRPGQTRQMFHLLQRRFPQLGLVLDCCGKPSSDLGDSAVFQKKNRKQLHRLQGAGIQHLITACPSCLQLFRQYGEGLQVSLAYPYLVKEKQAAGGGPGRGNVYSVHDPCTVRFDAGAQQAIRDLIALSGNSVVEMDHAGDNSVCCGEGGGTPFFDNTYAAQWQKVRESELESRSLVTYCSGCTLSLQALEPVHILDLVFPQGSPKKNQAPGKLRPYLNRLIFKLKMKLYFFIHGRRQS